MSTHIIDLIRMTPDGDLALPETVKARLRQLLERQPGTDAFSVYEEEGALVLVPVREVKSRPTSLRRRKWLRWWPTSGPGCGRERRLPLRWMMSSLVG